MLPIDCDAGGNSISKGVQEQLSYFLSRIAWQTQNFPKPHFRPQALCATRASLLLQIRGAAGEQVRRVEPPDLAVGMQPDCRPSRDSCLPLNQICAVSLSLSRLFSTRRFGLRRCESEREKDPPLLRTDSSPLGARFHLILH
jgi:hypothetical protein